MKNLLIGMLTLLSLNSFANECEMFLNVNSTTLTAAKEVQASGLSANTDYLSTKGSEIENNCPDGELTDEFIDSYCSKGRKVVAEVLTNITLLSAQGNSTANSVSFEMMDLVMSLKDYCEKQTLEQS